MEPYFQHFNPDIDCNIEDKHLREEMAMKYLTCTAQPASSDQADMLMDLWNEYEEGQSKAAQLVKQIDKLECLQQAVLYQQRYHLPLEEFMNLKDNITLPELQPLLKSCLSKYDEVRTRQRDAIVVVFVSGECRQMWTWNHLIRTRRPRRWQRHSVQPSR
jgi:5'-deoxynucleotidase YfbR-like HD superfamily hydrolase